MGGEPFFVAGADGPYLVDTDGRRYVDYVQSWGASILGHAHPAVVDAVQRAAAAGTSYGAPTEREVELAEAIAARVPSVDKVRLVSSGTEAAMTAVRLARGATGRPKILKFAGCYHGHVDALLVAGGEWRGHPRDPGLRRRHRGHRRRHRRRALQRRGRARRGVRPLRHAAGRGDRGAGRRQHGPGGARATASSAGCSGAAPTPARCSICDEVITGFRLGPAGAQGRYDLTPDLSMFGKVVGGGLPLAALGGRADLMDQLAPLGPVYQAGTLSGNPLATAAGLAVLGQLDDDAYAVLAARATRFADGLAKALPDAQVTQVGTLTGIFFRTAPVTNYEEAQQADHGAYARFFHAMLDAGIFLAPSGYETLFVSLAHTDDLIDQTVEAAAAHD